MAYVLPSSTNPVSKFASVAILRRLPPPGPSVLEKQDALDLGAKALDFFDVTEATEIARFMKKEFDGAYGPGLQCIVGTDFDSFVTHCSGCFVYFCIGSLAILLFKGSASPELETSHFAALETVKA